MPAPPLYTHRSHGREGAIFRLGERWAHAPALERLRAERSDRSPLYGDARRSQSLQHNDTGAAQFELDREQEPDRAGAYNYHIDLLVHGPRFLVYVVVRGWTIRQLSLLRRPSCQAEKPPDLSRSRLWVHDLVC